MNIQGSEDTQSLPTGTRLEEFVIERVLGAGGFGITYLARDTRLDRQVVIKENLPALYCFRDAHSLTVAPRHTHGDEAENFAWSLENFSREAAMLASLDHPGIVKVLRSFEAFGTAYFVMPYVEGMPLDELVKQRAGKPFSEEELRGLLERVLKALGYLHDRGIYHRDIKPGNLLITNEGLPVLIDFGSARQRLSERSMTVVESPGYTPFEQLQSRGNVGPWSDVYALGATFSKLLTGEGAPKATDRAFDDPWVPLGERAALIGSYSKEFLGGVDRAFRPRPEDRWQCAMDWFQSLMMREESVNAAYADPASPSPRTPEQSDAARGGQGMKRLAAAMGTASVIAAGLWLMLGMDSKDGGSDGDSSEVVQQPSVMPVKTGGLVVTSEPSGARVLDVARNELGVTPLEIKNLPGEEPWMGFLELHGYEAMQLEEMVPEGDSRLVGPVMLQPQPQKVIVTSVPSGAEVVEGGVVIGVTPWESAPREVGSEVQWVLRKGEHEEAGVEGMIELGKSLVLQGVLQSKPRWIGRTPGEEKVVEIAPGVQIIFCWIPPGEFLMGSPSNELGRFDDETQKRVTISKGFWLAKTEVTQAQWRAGGGVDTTARSPAYWDGKDQYTWDQAREAFGTGIEDFRGDALPVERVEWNEARAWCAGLNQRLRDVGVLDEGWQLSLPTEAQWEYACRAGTDTALNHGRNLTSEDGRCRNLDEVAWYDENSGYKTQPVGGKKANAWGLHDMHGNVWEWCEDAYQETLPGGADPLVSAGPYRVFRGGGWRDRGGSCRSSARRGLSPDFRHQYFGFRLAAVPAGRAE